VKRRAKLHDAYLAEFDRALSWAKLPTSKGNVWAQLATAASESQLSPRETWKSRLCKWCLAPWRSGYAAACKAVYTGSIPVGAFRVSRWMYIEGAPSMASP
jgi:hypothetical protein